MKSYIKRLQDELSALNMLLDVHLSMELDTDFYKNEIVRVESELRTCQEYSESYLPEYGLFNFYIGIPPTRDKVLYLVSPFPPVEEVKSLEIYAFYSSNSALAFKKKLEAKLSDSVDIIADANALYTKASMTTNLSAMLDYLRSFEQR